MTAISRADLLKELLPGIEKLFGVVYENRQILIEYHMRSRYGKYSIYKWEYGIKGGRTSTTLAKGLDLETAEGMMKLLKEPT
jgi:hypothetical protein